MSNLEWEKMNDNDFEKLLEGSVSEPPPGNIASFVTPWKKPMNRILFGMALTAVTLNFLFLNYILPAVGAVLQLLGFRALRRENKWFTSCYILTLIRTSYLFSSLILNTSIVQKTFYSSPTAQALTIINSALLFIELLCLWRGFISVQKKANLPPHAGGAVALIFWYAFMLLLALIRYNGLIIATAMLIGYVFIIISLYKLSKELDEAGYEIHAAPIKASDRCIVITLALLLLIGFFCGCTFGSRYPMKWSALDASEHANVEDIKSRLISLGFPEHVLNDVSAEDIAACDGARRVVVNAADESKGLNITGIGVQIPGEHERWIIFHHFLWTADSKFCGTDSIRLWPAYRNNSEGWHSSGNVTGRVLYDKNGKTFTSDYYFLGSKTYTSNSIFTGNQQNTDVFASFSMPQSGEHQRGYVAYTIDEAMDGYIIDSWFNYTHQQSLLQYPAVTAMESQMTNAWNDSGVFKTVQTALQFFPQNKDL